MGFLFSPRHSSLSNMVIQSVRYLTFLTNTPARFEWKAINREYIDMPEVVDDKSAHCVSFIVDHMSKRSSDDAHQPPLFIGVNGPQGSGKSTLVSVIDRQHAT